MFIDSNAVNNNVFIYGDVGAGKTYLMKDEAMKYLRKSNNRLYIIDFYGEYIDFAKYYGGDILSVGPSYKCKINPFYIRNNNSDINSINECLSYKTGDLCELLYNDFSYFELAHIRKWLLQIYNKNEEITFSSLLHSINQLKTKTNEDQMLLTKWEHITMQYVSIYLDCKNTIDISTVSNNLIVFDLSHIGDVRELSILVYSILYLIWEDIECSQGLYKSRILIDHIESLDRETDYYIRNIMKRTRINNSGIILGTNNYRKLKEKTVLENYYLSYTGTQLIMRINQGIIDKITEDMDLSIHEIEHLKYLNVGEYVKYPKPREEIKEKSQYFKYSYFISFHFKKDSLFKINKKSGYDNIALNIDNEIKSRSDILEIERKIELLTGYSRVIILKYQLMNEE